MSKPRTTRNRLQNNPYAPPAAAPAVPPGAAPSAGEEGYALTAARRDELTKQVLALGDDLLFFPGRSRDRVRWAHRIRVTAERDAADLVRAPFFEEPPLTREEIAAQRDHIELFRVCESEFQARRAGQATATREFARLAAEATEHKNALLRAFDLRFRNDPEGQKRVVHIRAGDGDADLVQDVSDVVLLASQNMAYLESCPRGEAQSAKRLAEISPQLSHFLGAKTLSDEARAARRLRDGAYTLIMNTERRIRAAAEYWYGGTERMKEYAVYVAPSGPALVGEEDEGDGTPEPAPAPGPAVGEPTAP